MNYSALVIGCGNIGALYDLQDPSRIWTHAKAYAKYPGISLTVADADEKVAKRVAGIYKVDHVKIEPASDFTGYDIISLTTPTSTHYSYLEALLRQNIPLVICEKPVTDNAENIGRLQELYRYSKSRVLVNYMRRFQPAFRELRERVLEHHSFDPCTGINIKYQRGFLNNGSHAFDLLEYIFNTPFSFDHLQLQSGVYDTFANDPTVTGSCNYKGINVSFLGVVNAAYPVFEIELFFASHKIVICHSGNEIRFYATSPSAVLLEEIFGERKSGILEKYMMPVLEAGLQLLEKNNIEDNFETSLELNSAMLEVLKKKI